MAEFEHAETGDKARNPVGACTTFYMLASSHREFFGVEGQNKTLVYPLVDTQEDTILERKLGGGMICMTTSIGP
jgi:hypothetical protein